MGRDNPKSRANLKEFQPGQTGNPKGSSAKAKIIGQLRKLTAEHVKEVASILLDGDREKLNEVMAAKDSSMLTLWLANGIAQSTKKGDFGALNALLDRVTGKVPQKLEHTGEDGGPVDINVLSVKRLTD